LRLRLGACDARRAAARPRRALVLRPDAGRDPRGAARTRRASPRGPRARDGAGDPPRGVAPRAPAVPRRPPGESVRDVRPRAPGPAAAVPGTDHPDVGAARRAAWRRLGPRPMTVASRRPRSSPALNVCGIRLGAATPCVLGL